MTMPIPPSEAKVKQISMLVDQWIDFHKGEGFDLDTICRQLNIMERDGKHSVVSKLARDVKSEKLEKSGRLYRVIDNTLTSIDWVNATEGELLDIHWPFGHEDGSVFSFDGRVKVSPGDLMVIAGVSNMGKTTFCLNFLWENMDIFHCRLMGNEYQASKFKRRVSHMQWGDPLTEHGAPKFDLIERYDGWKDAVDPDAINIIDWINLDDKFYMIGSILQGIRAKLRKGIALIALQKNAGKELGTGGGFSEHLASLYLALDFERITVKKAKEWQTVNPNGAMDGFTIVNSGTSFHNIRSIKKCPKCYGFSVVKGTKCDACRGTGYVDRD